MKTKFITSAIAAFLLVFPTFAQDKTTVRANSSDISDNLDLRAVATIFGDAADLEDFERRLNDPKSQISNLDLNNDNYVDYLRVIESIEGNAHIIVIQAVLDKDIYQDIATVEVERDSNNNVQVQVVGDVYMYGNNYIYEPVYVHRPIIYTTFWVSHYRPYYSSWYWGYYPSYYTFWRPFPVFRYRNHIAIHINFGHSYHYVTTRRCSYAYNSYYGRRANGYERRYPNRSFSHRHNGYANRYELDRNRNIRTRVPGSRELAYNSGNRRNSTDGITPRTYSETRRNNSSSNTPKTYSEPRRNNSSSNTPRTYSEPRRNNSNSNTPRTYSEPRRNNSSSNTPRTYSESRRNNSSSNTPRTYSEPRRNNSSSNRTAPQARSGSRQSGNSSGMNRSSGSRNTNSNRGNADRSGRI